MHGAAGCKGELILVFAAPHKLGNGFGSVEVAVHHALQLAVLADWHKGYPCLANHRQQIRISLAEHDLSRLELQIRVLLRDKILVLLFTIPEIAATLLSFE